MQFAQNALENLGDYSSDDDDDGDDNDNHKTSHVEGMIIASIFKFSLNFASCLLFCVLLTN